MSIKHIIDHMARPKLSMHELSIHRSFKACCLVIGSRPIKENKTNDLLCFLFVAILPQHKPCPDTNLLFKNYLAIGTSYASVLLLARSAERFRSLNGLGWRTNLVIHRYHSYVLRRITRKYASIISALYGK